MADILNRLMNLYDHQKNSVAHLLDIFKSKTGAVDASDAGSGKTLVGVEVMRAMDLPTVVVSPKAVMPNWKRTALAQSTDLDVINYEMLRTGRTPYGYFHLPKGCRKPRFQWFNGVKFVIFDEGHRCKSFNSINAELMRATRRQGIRCLILSATLADSPLELDAAGFILGLHDSDSRPTLTNPDPLDFWRWARRYGCGPGVFSKFDFIGSPAEKQKHMLKLFKTIFPARGVRVRLEDLPWFPKTQITAELYESGFTDRINQLYDEMSGAIEKLNARDARMKFERLERAREAGFEGDCLPDDPMIEHLRQRQKIELLKVPIFMELAKDAVASGMSVIIFVNFRQTIEELSHRLETNCVISGAQVGKNGELEREDNRLQFQDDQERIIICQSDAGGVGLDLHDVTGKHPRLSLISPGFNAKILRQICGRPCRAGGKSKSIQRVIFCAGTVEEPIQKVVASKLDRLDALIDGDLLPQNLQFA
jgi:superfamily II DNA or RNA helicase